MRPLPQCGLEHFHLPQSSLVPLCSHPQPPPLIPLGHIRQLSHCWFWSFAFSRNFTEVGSEEMYLYLASSFRIRLQKPIRGPAVHCFSLLNCTECGDALHPTWGYSKERSSKHFLWVLVWIYVFIPLGHIPGSRSAKSCGKSMLSFLKTQSKCLLSGCTISRTY